MCRRLVRALALWAAVGLTACGGGGGGGSASGVQGNVPGGFSAQFTPASLAATELEGLVPQGIAIQAQLNHSGLGDLAIFVSYDDSIVSDVSGFLDNGTLSGTVILRGDLPPGTYDTEIRISACLDEACAQEAQGSPARVPLRFVVKPNVQVQRQLQLGRTGAEAAPAASLPVTVPAEAGALTLQVSAGRPDAMAISFDGSQLRVQTAQLPAGIYTATATLQSASDPRYARSVDIRYTVNPPAGGEVALSISPTDNNVFLPQAGRETRQLLVTRPSWTDAWDGPSLFDDQHLLALTDRGAGRYDLTFDAANLPTGSYSPTVCFSAGPTGGTACQSFTVSVGAAFYLDTRGPDFDAASTAADLQWTHTIVTADGVTNRWTAVSKSPYLRVLQGSGRTGIDPLQVALDPAALQLPVTGYSLPIEVSIDRAGTLPDTFFLEASNGIPTLQRRSPAVLVGTAGRVYLEGTGIDSVGSVLPAWLQVSGAAVGRVQVLSDTRFLGSVSVLALDLSGAVPGQPVTVRVNSALKPTQVQFAVQSPLRAPPAFQALPFGAYRPLQYAPGLDAAFFSSDGVAYRWRRTGATWTLAQSAQPGLIDVALGGDEQNLFAIDAGQIVALDPLTFARRSAGAFTDDFQRASGFDSAAPPGMRALAFAADGRSMASLIAEFAGTTGRGAGLVCSWAPFGDTTLPLLTSAPTSCDPGQRLRDIGSATGSGMARSANGGAVVAVDADGVISIYDTALRQWASGGFSVLRLAAGQTAAAVNDAGTRILAGDGALYDPFGLRFGSLASVVPSTHLASGYGLTSDGRYGLVYGVRLTGAGTAQRAADATLWVVDLTNVAPPSGVATAPVVATIALPSAVGCTAAPVAGETCLHTASVTVAPGDGTAFVLGPRGVLAVPLPAAVATAALVPSPAGRSVLRRVGGTLRSGR